MPKYLTPSPPRYTAGEERYQDTRSAAEDELARAEEALTHRQRDNERENARLVAQLRKTEISVLSLEAEIEQKVRLKWLSLKLDYFLSDTGK